MSTSDDLTLKQSDSHTAADGFKLQRTYDGPTGSNTLQTKELVEDAATSADISIETQETTEQHLVLSEFNTDSEAVNVNDGETVSVTSVGGSSATLSPSNAGSISVQSGDDLTFSIESETDVTVSNQRSGASVTFDATSDSISVSGSSVTLEEASGSTIDATTSDTITGLQSNDIASGSSISTPQLLLNQEFESGGGGVSEVSIIAIKGSGADQINLEQTTITTIGPSGTNTLTYGGSSASQGETFGVQAVQDEDESLPVMTDADRFRIIVDPGTLATGETMTLEVTTESGATTEIRISVPNTLSGETAVQV
ncbi:MULTISPECIES: hypothetical protein [Haloarcula]|uniref:hypothetical protein n=1 Tax=Haloarcula TaxID=2237 RepID=UPI003742041B